MKVCLFSEGLIPPFDEGIKNVAIQLASALVTKHETVILTTGGHNIVAPPVTNVPANRLLWSTELQRRIRYTCPDLVLYIPRACATLASFLRARVLQTYAGGARTVLVTLQPRSYGPLTRLILRYLTPNGGVIATSPRTATELRALGCQAMLWAPGVDVGRFSPAEGEEKQRLRHHYGVSSDAWALLHVGHIKEGRGVEILQDLQSDGVQVVLVGSTSTIQNDTLAKRLQDAGILIIREYISRIEEIYRLADCYLFLTTDDRSAIEVPLSVLEAMACNLPVITTRYGGLPALFSEGDGFFYLDDCGELESKLRAARASARVATRAKVLPYDWSQAMRRLLNLVTGDGVAA